MKKTLLKSLALNKKSISNLLKNSTKAGAEGGSPGSELCTGRFGCWSNLTYKGCDKS